MSETTTLEAVLRILSLGLEAPIFPGTRQVALSLRAGHIEGTSVLGVDGNIGLAAHRDKFLRILQDIEIGTNALLGVEQRPRH